MPDAHNPIRRVGVVVPCFARADDLGRLLFDLERVHEHAADEGLDLDVVVVDNASPEHLEQTVNVPQQLSVRWLRTTTNSGGSGGFNAGMSLVMQPTNAAEAPDALWLVDSDARVTPRTLLELVRTLDADPTAAAAGSAIADPQTGCIFEVGGRINRLTGELGPWRTDARDTDPFTVDYVAACSMLVRTSAVERAGLMPWTFVNGDDATWGVLLARETGGRVVAVPTSVVRHPRFVRMNTWARFYQARNAFGPIDALALGPAARFLRALKEGARAAGQQILGRSDLAELHIKGLREAARRSTSGPAPDGAIDFEPSRHLSELNAALPEPAAFTAYDHAAGAERASRLLMDAGWRRARTRAPLAIVRAKDGFRGALRHDALVLVDGDNFVIRSAPLARRLVRAAWTMTRGLELALRLARRHVGIADQPIDHEPADTPASIDAIVVSYNRHDALGATLAHLRDIDRIDRIIVVDNASSPLAPQDLFDEHRAELIQLDENTGVEAFNVGVRASEADCVLILDDDAWPEPDTFDKACELMDERPELGAVALLPVHPRNNEREWPFAPEGDTTNLDWPVMGCGNLVRRRAWIRAGGYERDFFLYRNDTDLALKLRALGFTVACNANWVVWHDSPAATRKSTRWHELATRNWLWMMRRHAGPIGTLIGSLVGAAWAHKLSRLSPARHLATLRGIARGLGEAPPLAPTGTRRGGVRRLLRLRFRLDR